MKRSLVVIALVSSVGPGIAYGIAVIQRAHQSAPHVQDFRDEAERLGVEVTPESLLDVGFIADPPPQAIVQSDLVTLGRQTFDGDPADGGLLFWPLLVAATAALSAWAVVGAGLVIAASGQGWLRITAAAALLVALALIWIPPIYYGDVIDVVSYYVD